MSIDEQIIEAVNGELSKYKTKQEDIYSVPDRKKLLKALHLILKNNCSDFDIKNIKTRKGYATTNSVNIYWDSGNSPKHIFFVLI